MYTAEHARTGSAAVARIAARNPMEVLARLREKFPEANTEVLFIKWKDEITNDEDLLSGALHHAFTNILAAIDRMMRNTHHKRGAIQAERHQELISKSQQIVETVKRVVCMNLILPNGKALRYCTFAECAAAGGWFAKVAKLGKPNQIVGTVATEEQLAKIKA